MSRPKVLNRIVGQSDKEVQKMKVKKIFNELQSNWVMSYRFWRDSKRTENSLFSARVQLENEIF